MPREYNADIEAVQPAEQLTSYEYSQAHVFALTKDLNAVMDFRAISDTDKGAPAIPFRGTLADRWEEIQRHNSSGMGIFLTPAEMDGLGRKLENVHAIRAHYLDLDSGSVEANAERADQSDLPPSFRVHSSPGKQHCYWSIATPYQDNARFEALQRRLAQEYGGDPKVIDATRVMRLSGTWSWKYEKPHFVTCTAMRGYSLPRPAIEALEAAYRHVQVIGTCGGTRRDLGDPELAAPSLDWLTMALALVDPNALDRSGWLTTSSAFKQAGWTLADESTLTAIWSSWCARFERNDPAENAKLWRSIKNSGGGWDMLVRRNPALRATMAFGVNGEGIPATTSGPSQNVMSAAEIAILQRSTNDDFAIAFDLHNPGRFKFNYETKRWYEYDGRTWVVRDQTYMLAEMREFCRDKGGYEAKQPRSVNFWDGCLKAYSASKELLVPQRAFDSDRYLLNTPGGTVDLRTGTMRPHDARDLLTHCTTASPGPSNGAWSRFVDDITGGDGDTARYLQLVMGSALSGGIEEQTSPFLSGSGRNGKSVFTETIMSVMGDYATTVASSVLVETRSEQHTTGLTDFAGRRLCIGSEVGEGAWFNTETLKKLTGDAVVKARRMGMDFYEFPRTWRLVLTGNDLPQIRESNVAMKARMRIVPFRQCYEGREDRQLSDKLAADAPGVLSWLLDGHAAWLAAERHSAPSQAVEDATKAYFAAQSSPETWLGECCDRVDPDHRAHLMLPRASDLYANYVAWKHNRGEAALSLTKFSPRLEAMGLEKVTTNSGMRFRGIALKVPEMPQISHLG